MSDQGNGPDSGMDAAFKIFCTGMLIFTVGVGFALGWGWALTILGALFVTLGAVAYFEFSRQKYLVEKERRFKQQELIDDE